jgi:amino acid permease
MDWFHKRLRHRASMLTPVGESPSLFGSTINLINGSLDAGILAMPLVLAKVGWLLGLFLTGLVAVLGIYTTRLLVMVGVAENTRSYHMTVRHVLGKRVMNVFQFIIIATCMGGLLAYLMLIGDFAVEASLLLGGHVINRNSVIAIMAIFVVLPLSLMRKIKSLWFTGFMALGFVSFCTVALFVELCRLGLADAPDNPDGLPGYKQYGGIAAVSTTLPEFFHALPIAVFACSNHIVVFPVFSEMRQQSVTAFTKVTTITYTVLGALYGCTG